MILGTELFRGTLVKALYSATLLYRVQAMAAYSSPAIIERGALLRTGTEERDTFSLFSWNILADCYLKDGKGDYGHVPRESVVWDWSQRCQFIVDEIKPPGR